MIFFLSFILIYYRQKNKYISSFAHRVYWVYTLLKYKLQRAQYPGPQITGRCLNLQKSVQEDSLSRQTQ